MSSTNDFPAQLTQISRDLGDRQTGHVEIRASNFCWLVNASKDERFTVAAASLAKAKFTKVSILVSQFREMMQAVNATG